MKTLVIAMLLCIITSCDMESKSTTESTEDHFIRESNELPMGSRIIRAYDHNWMKWEFEGHCFLSRYLAGHQPLHLIYQKPVMVLVPCAE